MTGAGSRNATTDTAAPEAAALTEAPRPLPDGIAWCPDPRYPAHADGPHVHPVPNVGPHGEDWSGKCPTVPHPHDRGHGWLKDDGSMVPVLPNTVGLWTDTPSVVGAATTLAPTVPDALLLGSAKADALRRALNELDTYAAGGPADLTKELRALLGLPRKT